MGLKKGEKNETNKDKQNTQNDKTEIEKPSLRCGTMNDGFPRLRCVSF